MNQKLKNYFLSNKDKRNKLILKLRVDHTLSHIAKMLDYPDGVVIYYLVKGLLELDNKEQADYIFTKIRYNKLTKDEFKTYIKEKRKRKKEKKEKKN